MPSSFSPSVPSPQAAETRQPATIIRITTPGYTFGVTIQTAQQLRTKSFGIIASLTSLVDLTSGEIRLTTADYLPLCDLARRQLDSEWKTFLFVLAAQCGNGGGYHEEASDYRTIAGNTLFWTILPEPTFEPILPELPALEGIIKELTFGCEIECYLKNTVAGRSPCVVGGYHHGVQIPGLPEGWNAQSDASITANPQTGYTGMEIVSPKLKGREGVESIRKACQWIKQHGGMVKPCCGFHVHVGLNRHLTTVNINKLIMLCKYWEPALYAITGTISRERGGYCMPRTETLAKTLIQYATIRDKSTNDERRRLLNLQPLSSPKKTVEFRVFSGTVNFTKIMAYIQIALGLCEAACGNISMGSMKFEPSGRLATELAKHRYQGIVRELIRYVWRIPARPNDDRPRGAIAPEMLPECKDELMRLAKSYQSAKLEAEIQ